MTTNHEPRAEFIQRLEERVSAEARRRTVSGAARPPRWMPRSPLAAAAALAAVVIASMGLGGAVVAARYQDRDNQQRELLATSIRGRVALAKEKLKVAQEKLVLAQQRVARGVENEDALKEARLVVAEGEANVKTLEIQLEEVHASGREPQDAISAPLVAGRDYVIERIQIQLGVAKGALSVEQSRLSLAQHRFSVGAANQLDLTISRIRVIELEHAVEAIERKIRIRQQFTAQQIDGPMAELRAIEVDAERRFRTLRPRLELAVGQVQDMKTRVEIGTASPLDLKEAQVRVIELETELSKAELDIMIVRKQIDQRKGK